MEHHPDRLTTADYRARAQARAAGSPTGVGVAVERTANGQRGRPGRTWECVVTDGAGEFHFLEVWAPDVRPFDGVPPTRVEQLVEATAARLGGLGPLRAQGMLELERGDLGLS